MSECSCVDTTSGSALRFRESAQRLHSEDGNSAVETLGEEGEEEDEPSTLDKIDSFLERLEHKLNNFESLFVSDHKNQWELAAIYKSKIEHLGAETIASVQNTYGTLVHIQKMINEKGRAEADSLLQVLEARYEDIYRSSSLSAREKIKHALKYMDEKMIQLESSMRSIHPTKLLEERIETSLKLAEERLLKIHELPEPWQDNVYIYRGYRFHSHPIGCLRTIFTIHNESANIWTHLLGSLYVAYLGIVHIPSTSVWVNGSLMDRLVLSAYSLAAFKCLICSSTWHTFTCISKLHLRSSFVCVDYTGITTLITISIVTTEYAALHNHALYRDIYIAVSVLAGLYGLNMNWKPKFDQPSMRKLKILFFLSLPVSGLIAGAHAMFFYGIADTFAMYAPLAYSFAPYLLGVVFYAFLIPERFRSDTVTGQYSWSQWLLKMCWVDYILASHNVWHVFVFLGILGHYSAMIHMFEMMHV